MTTTKLQKKIKATKKPKVWQNENTSRLLQDKGADACNPVLGPEGQRTQVKTSHGHSSRALQYTRDSLNTPKLFMCIRLF